MPYVRTGLYIPDNALQRMVDVVQEFVPKHKESCLYFVWGGNPVDVIPEQHLPLSSLRSNSSEAGC